jgi:PAS domain S-box-containing protein
MKEIPAFCTEGLRAVAMLIRWNAVRMTETKSFTPGRVIVTQSKAMAVTGYHHFRRMAAAYWVLLLGLIVTLLVYQRVAKIVNTRDRLRFQTETDSAFGALRSRVNHYISALQSLQGFFHADESVTPDKWKRYVPSLVWHREYPNMLELGYVERVEAERLPGFLEARRANGWPELQIQPSGRRQDYYPILLFESRLAGSRHGIGYDLGTEPEQLAAMQRACDRSVPASSGVVSLGSGSEESRLGQVVYVPVYRGGREPRTVEERRANLRGFVIATSNAADLYRDTLREETSQVLKVEISDVTPSPDAEGKAASSDVISRQGSSWTRTITLSGLGRWWEIVLSTQPSFAVNSARSVPPLVLGSGLALSVLVFGIVWVQTRGRTRAEELITELKKYSAELHTSQQLLASITHNISEGIYRSTPDRGLIYVNDAFVKVFGYGSMEEMLRVPAGNLYANPARHQELIALLERDGRFVNEEVEFVRRDGAHFWGLTSSIGIRDEMGTRLAYYDGAINDITERKLAEDKARRSEATTRTINYFASSLFEQNTEDEILWDLAENCVAQLGFVDCVVYLVNRDAKSLTQKAAFGPKNPEGHTILNPIAIQVGHGIVGAVAATGRPVLIADTSLDPRYIVDDERRGSELAVPIVASGEVIGVIDSEHPEKHFFTQDHLAILTSIASLCANKLVRAWTEQKLRSLNVDLEGRVRARTTELETANTELRAEIDERERAEKLRQAIYQISEAVHTARGLPSLYHQIHEIIRRLMSANNLYIASHDPANDLLSFPYYVDEADPAPPTRPLGKGFTEYVLRTGQPLLANGEKIAELIRQGDYDPVGSPCAIWLGVPLSLHGQTFGVLAIQEYRDPNAFGEEEKRMLMFVAEQIAIAIDRKRAEAELRESAGRLRQSEERFSKAFLASPAMVSLARLSDGVFVEVNETFQQLTGYLEPEVIGRTAAELNLWTGPESQAGFLRLLKEKGFVRDWEETMRSKGGQLYTVLLSAELIEIDNWSYILAVGIDITARKHAESELHKALAKEKELGELKSNFVSMVSHEFRTPLGIIMSSSEILERYLERLGPEQRVEQLQAVRKSVRRMAGLMEEVLLLGKAEAGQMEFKPVAIDLAAFCSRLTDELLSATDRRCPIHFRADPLPPYASGDESLLRHIFTNLLANAVKYSQPGSPVHFSAGSASGQAVFRVRDQGLGIPEVDQERLFRAFHRGGNVGHIPGTGLGLSIVKRCVDLHGGTIEVESTEAAGTTFIVSLPLFGDAETGLLTGESGVAFPGCEEADSAKEIKAGVVEAPARAL